MKSNFWIRIGKNVFEEVSGKIKDGVAIIGEKKFIIDDNEGFDIIKNKFGGMKKKKEKYYILDWKALKPLKIDEKSEKFTYDKINSKVLKRITENELLYWLLRKKSKVAETSDIYKYIMAGFLIGGIFMYFLIVGHIIPIQGV